MSELYKTSITKLHMQLIDFKRRYVSFVTKNPEAVNQVRNQTFKQSLCAGNSVI